MVYNEMYSKELMRRFRNPKNFGEIKNADGIGKVGNPTCLIPKTRVHSNDKFIELDKVNVEERVLGHNGLYNNILKKFKRKYKGHVIYIKNKLGEIILTPEHEVLAVKIPKRWKYGYSKNKKQLLSKWYHAYELENKDFIVYPILKEEKDLEFIELKQEKKKYDFRSKSIPQKIEVNEKFLRLCGYYLAEGYLKDEVTKTRLGLCFSIKEENLVEDVINIVKDQFGIDAIKKIREKNNTIIIEVNNVFIVRLFKSLFGTGAVEKKIPHWMMLLPIEKQKSLLYGLWKGDGYFNTKKRAGYSTISYQLSQQIKTLLLRQKIIPSIYTEKEKIDKKGTRHKKAYRIHVGDRDSLEKLAKILNLEVKIDKSLSIKSWFDNNYLYIPITKIEKRSYDGDVCNLKVENAMSYTTESFCVHNCGDVMWLFIKIKKDKIEKIKFKTFGCPAAISVSDMVCDLAKGKTIKEAKKITNKLIAEKLHGLPKLKYHCSLLGEQALLAAIKDYEKKK